MLITDTRPGETDLLSGREFDALELRTLTGQVLTRIDAQGPWTHDKLVAAVEANRTLIDDAYGADYYLGEQWVGSTEV